jgi:putative methionine-R-sulfoxide reductase with GAF domain
MFVDMVVSSPEWMRIDDFTEECRNGTEARRRKGRIKIRLGLNAHPSRRKLLYSGAFQMGETKNIRVQIHSIVAREGERAEKARRLAEAVRGLGGYRWVGVYDVGDEMVSIVGYAGQGAPAYPSFSISEGLTGSAIRDKATVVVGDVTKEPRYLTAFGNTLSEIIVPILDPQRGKVIGTIDVESERANAFSSRDQQQLEECARAALPLWSGC